VRAALFELGSSKQRAHASARETPTHAHEERSTMREQTAHNRLEDLEQQHATLKEQVRLLERRAYLTPPEQRVIADLKKQKLQAKDLIEKMKRDR
jgi:hypothetical protein